MVRYISVDVGGGCENVDDGGGGRDVGCETIDDVDGGRDAGCETVVDDDG